MKRSDKKPTRRIPEATKIKLAAASAALCEFRGCNKYLFHHPLTLDGGNFSEHAHIVPFSECGPRGNDQNRLSDIHDAGNLMLLCQPCHSLIDSNPLKYSVDLLRAMKLEHEQRVRLQTAVKADAASHIVRFGANIGANEALSTLSDMQEALFPQRYPASIEAIDLDLTGSQFKDYEPEYWHFQQENLRRQFSSKVSGRIDRGVVRHFSVFALAPQPLLIELGRLLCEIVPADVYQRHREPQQSWSWPVDGRDVDLTVKGPEVIGKHIALILSVSANIDPARVTAVLGSDVSIWTVQAAEAHNDILKTRASLSSFRQLMRQVYRDVKNLHGDKAPINVFPALPVSMAIEVGRVWMPKADLPLLVWDEHRGVGGFHKCIEIRTDIS